MLSRTDQLRVPPNQRSCGPPRTSIIALADREAISDGPVDALARSLRALGVEVVSLRGESGAERIAEAVVGNGADSIELWLGGSNGIRLLRELLRELTARGRRDVTIVLHRDK